MPFDLETWKREAAAKLAQFKRTAAQASSHMTYTTLATLTLWPVVEAIGRGDVSGAINALMGVGAAAGAGIITQKALEWKGKADAEIAREAAQWIERSAVNDPALRHALDTIMTELRAVAHAQAGLSDADRAWFVETLRQETARIGSTLTIETQGGARGQHRHPRS
ncbi:MAG: hypothetical protein ACFLMY_19540 [Candidatus Brachytrichaceae bacterium NZ_4S206]|jgi:hypothetical protein